MQVIVHQVEAAEVDEMRSFVGSKSQQRWLWHAIDHHTGQVLAYVFGTREDETFGGVSIELIIATRRGESQKIHDTYQLN